MDSEKAKQLNIKVGVVKRLVKEVNMYGKEKLGNQAKIQELKQKEADDADVRQWEKVLAETEAMIPDTKGRLSTALVDLQNFLESFPPDSTEANIQELIAEAGSLV